MPKYFTVEFRKLNVRNGGGGGGRMQQVEGSALKNKIKTKYKGLVAIWLKNMLQFAGKHESPG